MEWIKVSILIFQIIIYNLKLYKNWINGQATQFFRKCYYVINCLTNDRAYNPIQCSSNLFTLKFNANCSTSFQVFFTKMHMIPILFVTSEVVSVNETVSGKMANFCEVSWAYVY